MAGHNEAEHGAMDISAHRSNYEGFLGWAKVGTVVCFVLAAIVVLILAS